jgi:hypothetical protein
MPGHLADSNKLIDFQLALESLSILNAVVRNTKPTPDNVITDDLTPKVLLVPWGASEDVAVRVTVAGATNLSLVAADVEVSVVTDVKEVAVEGASAFVVD